MNEMLCHNVRWKRFSGCSGVTLVEVMIGACVAAIGFMGCWMGLGQCLRIAAAHRETIAATECLMQRVEQTRAVGWGAITSATNIRDQILNTPLSDSATLSNLQEQITVTPYPALVPATDTHCGGAQSKWFRANRFTAAARSGFAGHILSARGFATVVAKQSGPEAAGATNFNGNSARGTSEMIKL